MLIQTLEQKTKLALATVFITVAGCAAICGFTIWKCTDMVSGERQQIYVLDGEIPFLAERAKLEANYEMEAKAHVALFHQYFFNLPPDDKYIEWSHDKAMCMADATAMKQRQGLKEKGFISDLVSSSAVCSIICDSIDVDPATKAFTYYGTQLIKRRTSSVHRSLITTGYLENIPRSHNNPHGLLITNWRTIENKDLKY